MNRLILVIGVIAILVGLASCTSSDPASEASAESAAAAKEVDTAMASFDPKIAKEAADISAAEDAKEAQQGEPK